MAQYINQVGYGLSSPLPVLAPYPIKANRVPTVNDIGYAIGQLWITPSLNDAWVLTSVVAGAATWIQISVGAGAFALLSSTGATTLATTGASVNTFGNTTGATSLSLYVGTGNFLVDGAPSSTFTVGTSTTTGTVTIGGTAQTGAITLGSSTGINIVNVGTGSGATTVNVATGVTNAKTVNIGTGAAMANNINVGGTGANVIAIGDTQTAGTISIGAAQTTGTLNLGSMGAGVGILTIAGGSGAQTVNIAASGTGAKTINIGASGSVDAITIGSTTTTSSMILRGGTGGVSAIASYLGLSIPNLIYMYAGAGVPANGLALHVGDLYINTTAATAATRMYIATGVGAWTNITCAA